MPNQTKWYGRYDNAGNPYGFDEHMRAVTGQQYRGRAVCITITAIDPPPSDALRKFFFVAYLPAFMEIMNEHADWDLLPTIGREKTEARRKTIAMFHRDHKIEVGDGGGHSVKPPRFSEMTQPEVLRMMERMRRFVEQWGYEMPEAESKDGKKKYEARH